MNEEYFCILIISNFTTFVYLFLYILFFYYFFQRKIFKKTLTIKLYSIILKKERLF